MGIERRLKKLKEYLSRGGIEIVHKSAPMTFEDKNVFKGRTVLITGAGSGIGKGLALGLANQGANVIITGRNEDKLKNVAALSNNIKYMIWDASDVKNAFNYMEIAAGLFGTVDVLVNNAGIYNGTGVTSLTVDDYDKLMNINQRGVYFITQAFIRINQDRHDVVKKIINVCSIRSFTGQTNPYALSKFAVRGFTEGLAKELMSDNYIVNGIAPGPTVSEINNNNNVGEDGNLYMEGKVRFHRLLVVDEIVNVAKFLISDYSNGINGQIIIVDGGETLR